MKQIWPNYSYSPATNVLTLTGLNIDRDQLLLVTAADRGRIMYNFADSSVTASAFTSGANTALTLVATTAGLTTTAALVIYYDDQVAGIAGTVTANLTVIDIVNNLPITLKGTDDGFLISVIDSALPAGTNRIGVVTIGGGTVTIGAGTAQIGSVTVGNSITIGSCVTHGVTIANTSVTVNGIFYQATQPVSLTTLPALVAGTAQIGSVTASISNSVTIASLPAISGTVTVGGFSGNAVTTGYTFNGNAVSSVPVIVMENSNGSIGTVDVSGGFITVTTGTAQIGSVTASISNSVTIASLPAISGTVTANLAISSSAITSGSFTSLTSATLVPANTARKMATVYNLGAGQLYINAGASATTLGGGFMVALSSGDFYECDYTTTTLSAIFATAGTASWVSH